MVLFQSKKAGLLLEITTDTLPQQNHSNQLIMKGLAPHISKIFEDISKLECIKPYVLVGGTALSLQLGNRQSEDLDFMSWRKSKDDKHEVD